MEGSDPEIVIELYDNKLNLDTYQQIIHKVYSVMRYKTYNDIQKKIRINKKTKRQKSNPNMNDSVVSSNSIAIGDEEFTSLINNIDIDEIQRDVFDLFKIQYGLDPTLALRKV